MLPLALASMLLGWAMHVQELCVHAAGETVVGSRVVYVAPNASDTTGDGSLAQPFTLAAARRSLSGKAAGATVMLRGGDYYLSSPFVLTGVDSGRPGAPVTYQSYSGERARITGAAEIPGSLFSPVPPPVAARLRPAAAGLQVADLRSIGVRNASMLGGSTEISRLKAELFIDDDVGGAGFRPALLSQDPTPLANGTWQWFGYDNIVTLNATFSTWFIFNDTEQVERGDWLTVANSSHGLWLLSFWGQDGVQAAKVVSLQPIRAPASSKVSAYNFSMELGPSRFRSGTYRFKAVDALEFVDSPEEYWIDREHLLLYFLPKIVSHIPRLVLSMSPTLMGAGSNSLVELRAGDSSSATAPTNVRLTNLSFYASTQGLLSAVGVAGVEVSGCDFVGAGDTCVTVNASDSLLKDNRIEQCGRSGLVLRGGNWNVFGHSLWRSANLSAVRCHIVTIATSILHMFLGSESWLHYVIAMALSSRSATRSRTSGAGIGMLLVSTGRE